MNLRITDLLDEYREDNIPVDVTSVPDTERIKEITMKKINRNYKTIRPLRIVLIAAAITVLLTGMVLGVMHYSRITNSMEEKWNKAGSEEMAPEQKKFIEVRSAEIGESVTDQGVTVTIDSVTCTTDTVYLMIHYVLDPEQYDASNISVCADSGSVKYVENENYGTCEEYTGGGGNTAGEDDGYWQEYHCTFRGLPEGASLADGNTTMHVEMSEIFFMTKDNSELPNAVGTWNFEFVLPQSVPATVKTSDTSLDFDTTLEFENGITLGISDIKVHETGCSFLVATDNEEYIFVGGDGDQAMLARAAQPDVPTFTMYANMADGSMVYGGVNMEWEPDEDVDQWTLEWATPLDPGGVISLTFSDGVNEIEVPLND